MASTAADKTQAHVKGKSVEPMSSVLKVETRDVDVSAKTQAPLDGEWLICDNGIGGDASTAIDDTLGGNGVCAKMVWSHKDRSDLQSTGRKRVPVLWMQALHCKLHLYNFKANDVPAAGDLLMLDTNKEALTASGVGGGAPGSALLATVVKAANAVTGWCVGTVINAGSAPVEGGGASGPSQPIEVMIFESPKWLSANDVA